MLYTSLITTVLKFIGESLPYPSLSEPQDSHHGREQCPSHSWSKGSSSQRSSVRPIPLIFGLTGLEERRYVASVLRRLLRSFPGAHDCHNPELGISQVDPPKNRQKGGTKITSVPAKASLKTHGRLRWLVDASSAICRPPSWGNVIGNDRPGAPGSSSEWSRGESSWSAEEGGREGPGRCSVNLRELSETSRRRRVIKERRRPRCARVRARVCPTYSETCRTYQTDEGWKLPGNKSAHMQPVVILMGLTSVWAPCDPSWMIMRLSVGKWPSFWGVEQTMTHEAYCWFFLSCFRKKWVNV